MGMVITVPEAGVDYILYGDNRQSVATYLTNQLAALPTHFTEFGNKLVERVKQTYTYLTDDLFHRTLQSRTMEAGSYFNDTGIRICSGFEDLQQASPSMQRYIMAHPGLRQLYLDQNVAGYGATYVNSYTGVGPTHYDYRRVMSGVPVHNEDSFDLHYYDEELEPGDKLPSYNEKVAIISTYETIDWLLKESKFDFTNPDSIVKRGD